MALVLPTARQQPVPHCCVPCAVHTLQESAVIRSVLGDEPEPPSSGHVAPTSAATTTSSAHNGAGSAPRSALRSGRPPVARRGKHVSLNMPRTSSAGDLSVGGPTGSDANGAGGGVANGSDGSGGRMRLALDVEAADSEPVPRVAPTPSPLPRAVAGSRGGGGRSRPESARKGNKVRCVRVPGGEARRGGGWR